MVHIELDDWEVDTDDRAMLIYPHCKTDSAWAIDNILERAPLLDKTTG